MGTNDGRKSPEKSLLGYYVHASASVLRRGRMLLGFLLASSMHGLGHAVLAAAGAGCATLLVGGDFSRFSAASSRHLGGSGATTAATFALAGLAAVVVKVLGNTVASVIQAQVGGEVGASLRETLLRALLAERSVAQARHSDHGAATEEAADEGSAPHGGGAWARNVARLTSFVGDVEAGASVGVLGSVKACLQLLPLAVLVFVVAPRLAAASVVVLLPFGVLLGRARRRVRRSLSRESERRTQLLAGADEAVRHADLWRTYGAGRRIRDRVRVLGHSLTRQSTRVAALTAALSGGNEVLGAAAVLLVVLAARAGWLGAEVEGTVLPFVVTFLLAYRPVRDLGDARLATLRASAALDELGPWMVRGEAEVADEALRAWPRATLTLQALELARGTLGPLSFQVKAGEIVALVAPTGSGKSTLLRTLLGLEAPRAGDVLYGKASLRDAPLGPRERPFAWVPQDAPIVADTLEGNVRLGGATADVPAVLTALGAASLAEVSSTSVGAGGRVLSGGERQWVALARALASEQPILLLDEPTSGLDAVAQEQVLAAIALLRGRRAVLLVTHRQEPLRIADRVLHLGEAGEKAA